MEEVGVNGQWGIFSMVIYRCCQPFSFDTYRPFQGELGTNVATSTGSYSKKVSFRTTFRQLIETHVIKDENYVLDEKGKAHFIFKVFNKCH